MFNHEIAVNCFRKSCMILVDIFCFDSKKKIKTKYNSSHGKTMERNDSSAKGTI